MKFTVRKFIEHLQELEAEYSISDATMAIKTENGMSHEPDIQINIAESLRGDVRLIIGSSSPELTIA